MVESTSGVETDFAPIYVELIRIRNFRGLTDCTIEFEPDLTLLVGRNNSGKSRVLRALGVALGGLAADVDDLTVGTSVEATIDVVIAPTPTAAESADDLFDDEVGRRLGQPSVVSEDPVRERFAWRTTIARSGEGFGAQSESRLLVFDESQQEWHLQEISPRLSVEQRALFAGDLIETGRDLVEEMGRRGSAVRRVLSDLDVEEEAREDLETRLGGLSEEIIGHSGTLGAVGASFEEMRQRIGGIGAPSLKPLPVRLEELARSVSVELNSGAGPLPMRLHGSGARSLASLQVQSVMYDRRLGRDGVAIRPHPVTLVEEPEAHLHPQAIHDLAGLLVGLRGQVIASTHSSHLVTAVPPGSIRLMRSSDTETTVIDLGPGPSNDRAIPRMFREPTTGRRWRS